MCIRISMNIKTLAPSVAGFVSISQGPANKTMFKQQKRRAPRLEEHGVWHGYYSLTQRTTSGLFAGSDIGNSPFSTHGAHRRAHSRTLPLIARRISHSARASCLDLLLVHVTLVVDVDRGARVRVDGWVAQRDVDFGVPVVVEAQVACSPCDCSRSRWPRSLGLARRYRRPWRRPG